MKKLFSHRKQASPDGQQPHRRPIDRERLKRAALSFMLVLNSVMFVTFCALMVRTNKKISQVNYQMAYLSDTTSVLLGNVSTMKSDIESTLEEESSLLESWSISLKDMNFTDNTYQVEIAVVPKKYTETTQTSVYFGTKSFPLQLDGYQFTGTADLTLYEAYDGNVTVLFVDGKSRETEVLSSYTDVRTDLTQVLAGVLYDQPVYEDGQLDINVNGYLRLDGGSFFVFDQLELVVEAEDRVIKSYDLAAMASGSQQTEAETETEQSFLDALLDDDGTGEDPDNGEAVYETPDQEAAAQADENLPVQSKELTWLAYSYSLADSISLDPGCHLRMYLKAVSRNGFTFTYDLFGADIEAENTDTSDRQDTDDAQKTGSMDKADTAGAENGTAEKAGSDTGNNTAAASAEADQDAAASATAEGMIREDSIDLTAHAVVYDSHGGIYILD